MPPHQRTLLTLLLGWAVCATSSAAFGETLPLDSWRRHVIESEKPWRSVFVASADLNQDGLKDIVTGGWWYQNPGKDGSEWARGWQRRQLGEPLHNMAVLFDFDRDGDTDVLGTTGKGSEPSAQFVWAENEHNGAFQVHRNIDEAQGDFLQGVAVGQLSGPNSLNVALSWHRGGSGIQMLSVPAAPASQQWGWRRISTESQDEQLSIGLINRDQFPDLLLGTKWLETTRPDELPLDWKVRSLHRPHGKPDRNRLFDMNQDGRLDAVVGYEAINRLGKLAWYGQPVDTSRLWEENIVAEVIGPMSVDVADLDQDGDPDVVVGEHNYDNPKTARLIVFENTDGKATEWAPHVIHTGDEHHDGAVLVDIDDDGDLDVISIGWKEPEVWLYENLAISH